MPTTTGDRVDEAAIRPPPAAAGAPAPAAGGQAAALAYALGGAGLVAGSAVVLSLAAGVADGVGRLPLAVPVFALGLLAGLVPLGWLWHRVLRRARSGPGPAGRPDPRGLARRHRWLAHSAWLPGLGLALAVGVVWGWGLQLAVLAGLCMGAVVGLWRTRHAGSRPAPAGVKLVVAMLALAGTAWLACGAAEVVLAESLAPWRARLFVAGLQAPQIESGPVAADGSQSFTVRFEMRWPLARYAEQRWQRVRSHDSGIPYSVPVIFPPLLEARFNEQHLGVSGRLPLGGRMLLVHHTVDGRRVGAGNTPYLFHQGGRHELVFRWQPEDSTVHRLGDGSACLQLAFLPTALGQLEQRASDRRFAEPARLVLAAHSFSPLRRATWGRERGFGRPGRETDLALLDLPAPFTPRELAERQLARWADPALPVCMAEAPQRPYVYPCGAVGPCDPGLRQPLLAAARATIAQHQARLRPPVRARSAR